MFAFLSTPIDTKANTFPFPNTLLAWPQNLPTLARKRTRPFYIPIHTMLPSILRHVDRGHVLLPDGWVVRGAPAPISPRMRPLRHSLEFNNLDDEAKKAVKDAAGSGVSITF